MRIWGTLAASAALVAGLATASHAQASATTNPLLPVQGTREVSLQGNLQFQPYDSYSVSGSYEYYLNTNLEVGGSLGYDYTKPSGSSSTDTFNIGPRVDYNFTSTSATVPYVGAFFGYSHQKYAGNTNNTSSYGLQGGVKHFLNPNLAAKAELDWRHFDKTIPGSSKKDSVGIAFGLAIFLH